MAGKRINQLDALEAAELTSADLVVVWDTETDTTRSVSMTGVKDLTNGGRQYIGRTSGNHHILAGDSISITIGPRANLARFSCAVDVRDDVAGTINAYRVEYLIRNSGIVRFLGITDEEHNHLAMADLTCTDNAGSIEFIISTKANANETISVHISDTSIAYFS